MRQRISTTAVLLATTATCGVLLAGCGQQEAGSAPSPSATPSASMSATASPSTSPSPKTTKLVRLKAGSSVEVPRSWNVDPEDGGIIVFSDPEGKLTCTLADFPGSPVNWKPTEKIISRLARYSMGDEPNNRRAADTIVDGVRMFHLIGKDPARWHDEFGTIRRGHVVALTFDGSVMLASRGWETQQIAKIMRTFRLR